MTNADRLKEIEKNLKSHGGTVYDLGGGIKVGNFYLKQVFDDYEWLIARVHRLEEALEKIVEDGYAETTSCWMIARAALEESDE